MILLRHQYRTPIICSLVFHAVLLFVLLGSHSESKSYQFPVAKKTPQQEIVKAVSVDEQQVMAEVSRLKQEKRAKRNAEKKRQNQLKRQAWLAKKKRINEEKKLAKVRKKTAALQKKRRAEERLAAKKLAALTRKKAIEKKRLARIQQEKDATRKRTQQEKQQLMKLEAERRVMEEKKRVAARHEAMEKKRRLTAQKAAKDKQQQAAKQARLRGEINKYKSLIIQAISRRWILPDKVDKSLSSKFRIRIAPGGKVLSVKLLRSSGDAALDLSAQRAIYKASPLPVPTQEDTFVLFKEVSLTVRPEGVLSHA